MAETTAVKIPSGARAKMKTSRDEMDSERNCVVTLSPNRVMRGA
jgi:hypothetical protein